MIVQCPVNTESPMPARTVEVGSDRAPNPAVSHTRSSVPDAFSRFATQVQAVRRRRRRRCVRGSKSRPPGLRSHSAHQRLTRAAAMRAYGKYETRMTRADDALASRKFTCQSLRGSLPASQSRPAATTTVDLAFIHTCAIRAPPLNIATSVIRATQAIRLINRVCAHLSMG